MTPSQHTEAGRTTQSKIILALALALSLTTAGRSFAQEAPSSGEASASNSAPAPNPSRLPITAHGILGAQSAGDRLGGTFGGRISGELPSPGGRVGPLRPMRSTYSVEILAGTPVLRIAGSGRVIPLRWLERTSDNHEVQVSLDLVPVDASFALNIPRGAFIRLSPSVLASLRYQTSFPTGASVVLSVSLMGAPISFGAVGDRNGAAGFLGATAGIEANLLLNFDETHGLRARVHGNVTGDYLTGNYAGSEGGFQAAYRHRVPGVGTLEVGAEVQSQDYRLPGAGPTVNDNGVVRAGIFGGFEF